MISTRQLAFTVVTTMLIQQVVPGDSHPLEEAPGQRHKLVLPPGQTVERIREKHGMTYEEFEEVHRNVALIKTLAYELKYHRKMNESLVAGLDEFIGDTLLSPEQSRYMMEVLTERKHRQKRNIRNFQTQPTFKWPSINGSSVVTIPYKFDGNHDSDDEATIEESLAHWETHTCVRFRKLGASEVYNDNYILFTNDQSRCWSYTGRIPIIPQKLNLQASACLEFNGIGNTAHEIGHVLGFWHEESRPDRDDYVTVFESNIVSLYGFVFHKKAIAHVETHGTKYDYSSLMHMDRKYLSSDPSNLDTLAAKDPLYSNAIGQRAGLSFLDTKVANIEYCSDVCPELPCLNNGYVDPNNCSICKCPDGYGGALCCEVATSDAACPMENAGSDGVIQVTSDVEQCFRLTNYSDGTQCNWRLRADVGRSIDMYFNNSQPFRLFCQEQTCLHWVEIKYRGDLSELGPRFCCETTPSVTLTSEGNEAVVTFRSNVPAPASWRDNNSLSFHLCYKLNDTQISSTDIPTTVATTSSCIVTPDVQKPLTKQEKAELTKRRTRIPVRFRKGGVKMCGQLYIFD